MTVENSLRLYEHYKNLGKKAEMNNIAESLARKGIDVSKKVSEEETPKKAKK